MKHLCEVQNGNVLEDDNSGQTDGRPQQTVIHQNSTLLLNYLGKKMPKSAGQHIILTYITV